MCRCLERSTKPLPCSEGDDGVGDSEFDDPTELSEMAAAFDAPSGDARYDGSVPQIASATIEVVGVVGMDLASAEPVGRHRRRR